MKRAILSLALLGVAPVSAMAADRDYGGRDGTRFQASIRIGGGHGGGHRPAPVVRHERVMEYPVGPVVHHQEPVILHQEPVVDQRHYVAVEPRYLPVDRHREVYVRPAPHHYGRRDARHGRGH